MPTQALAAYGIALRVSDGIPLAPIAVTNASNTTPIAMALAAPHGIADVGVVTITGVGGNLGANGRFIAQRIDNTGIYLRESGGTGAYTGGGTLTRVGTFASIAEMTNVQDAGVTATLIDVSAHDSGLWTSRLPTLLSGNAIRMSINFVPTHPTHNATTGLGHLLLTKARRDWMLVFPDPFKMTWAFTGFVANMREQAPVAGALTSEITIEFTDSALLSAVA